MLDASENVECSMHNPSSQQMMHHDCSDGNKVQQIIKSSFSPCCEIQTVDNKITDEFLSVEKDVFKENTFTIILLNVGILFNSINPSSISYFNIHNTSPPSPEADLYIHNSTLLI